MSNGTIATDNLSTPAIASALVGDVDLSSIEVASLIEMTANRIETTQIQVNRAKRLTAAFELSIDRAVYFSKDYTNDKQRSIVRSEMIQELIDLNAEYAGYVDQITLGQQEINFSQIRLEYYRNLFLFIMD